MEDAVLTHCSPEVPRSAAPSSGSIEAEVPLQRQPVSCREVSVDDSNPAFNGSTEEQRRAQRKDDDGVHHVDSGLSAVVRTIARDGVGDVAGETFPAPPRGLLFQ